VKLRVPNRLVYSAHCYSWSYPALPNRYEDLKSALGIDWGFLVQPDASYTAPVWVSEFGTFNDCRKHTCANWWPDFLRYLAEGDFDWAAWHGDGTNSRGTTRTFDAPSNYGILAPDWRTPANGGELLEALQTIMRPSMGPQVIFPTCNEDCADTFKPLWKNGRVGAAACSVCLRNRHCRGGMSAKQWCSKGWATEDCGWTCCRAGLLDGGDSVSACAAEHCKKWYVDRWNPQWPDRKANSAACLHCLRDPACNHRRSEAEWCSSSWASAHCELTCCIAGFRSPEPLRSEAIIWP